MNNELLFLFKKHADTDIEQTKSKPQETLGIKLNKQMETFSFSPPINLPEEGKSMLSVTSFETTNSGLSITNKEKSFSNTLSGHWNSESTENPFTN